MPRVAITPKVLEKARKLIARGRSPVEAAAELGIGKSQLYEHLKPRRDDGAKAPRRPSKPKGAERPADAPEDPTPVGTPDDLAILNEELRAARNARKLAARDKNYGKVKPLVETIASLVKQRRLMAPPVEPTLEELEARSRPKADEVLAKVRAGVRAVARGEAKTGLCARCQAHLTPEQLEQRRAEGGVDEEPARPPEAPLEAPPAAISPQAVG